MVPPAGGQRRRAGHVRPLLVHLAGTADDDVVDGGGVELGALLEGAEQRAEELDGRNPIEAAARLGLATGRAHRLEDVRLHQRSTTKETTVVHEPPMLSVATLCAPST